MSKWLTVVVLVLLVLVGAMGLRNLAVQSHPGVAGTTAPVPPFQYVAGTTAPVPPFQLLAGTTAPVPPFDIQ